MCEAYRRCVETGGDVTGLSIMATDLTLKRLQVLKDTLPALTRVAVLWNPDTPPHIKAIEQLRSLAPSLGIALSLVQARQIKDLSRAVSAARRAHAHAMYVLEDAVFVSHRKTLNDLVNQARLPAIFAQARVVEEGGFMSYGPNFPDLYRRSAGYVDKILKGAKPSDLPIEQPAKFELAVNLKTAQALGITIPESILLRADEVIS
jgi:putative ABC transport system substrate-binding protein